MKTLSLRFKYTLFISIFFAIAIAVSTVLSIKESIRTTIKIFVEGGTPLVQRGAEYVDRNMQKFSKIVKEQSDELPEYTELRKYLLSLKETSAAKYFYTMIPATDTDYMYIIDGSCDPSDEENFSALGTLETKDNYGEPAELALETGMLQSSEMKLQEGWGWLITVFCPITHGSKVVGFIAADYDATSLRASIRNMIIQSSVAAVLLIVIVTLLVRFILKGLFDRINKISNSIYDIASGKADLSRKIKIAKDDEIGKLTKTCNKLISNLANMISSIKELVESLDKTGRDVTKQTQQTKSIVTKATETVGEIDVRAKKQNETMDTLSEQSDEVEDTITILDQKIGMQTDAISQVSSSVEEISANIKSVDSNVNQISERYEQLVKVSKEGQKDQMTVVDRVSEIQAQAEHLKDANTVVAKIANQTNLLAMNAAIEAAHAGQAGQGFAVVAGEIRTLAESSAKQSKSISNVIKTITDAIAGIVQASKLSLSSFQSVDQRISEIQAMLEQVRGSIDEQQEGAHNLLDSMMVINNSSRSIQEASKNMKEQSDSVFNQIAALKTAASEITILSASTQNSMNTIYTQASNSSKAAEQNLEMSEKLFGLVESYKV